MTLYQLVFAADRPLAAFVLAVLGGGRHSDAHEVRPMGGLNKRVGQRLHGVGGASDKE